MVTGSKDKHEKPSFWQVCWSVLAALFGVQSEKARARDFTQGNPVVFIIIGALFIILFVLGVALVARLVLKASGA
jgi:hypothetical protein